MLAHTGTRRVRRDKNHCGAAGEIGP